MDIGRRPWVAVLHATARDHQEDTEEDEEDEDEAVAAEVTLTIDPGVRCPEPGLDRRGDAVGLVRRIRVPFPGAHLDVEVEVEVATGDAIHHREEAAAAEEEEVVAEGEVRAIARTAIVAAPEAGAEDRVVDKGAFCMSMEVLRKAFGKDWRTETRGRTRGLLTGEIPLG